MPYGAGIDDLLSPLKGALHKLEEENQQLKAQLQAARQELADLRRGIGITVLVGGKPVPTGTAPGQEALPPTTPGGPPGRPFAAPAVLNERRPPDVAPGPPQAGGYAALVRGGSDAPFNQGQRGGDLAKHFLED